MDREKLTLFVNGNILCRDYFRTTTETDFENITPNADADDFDLSDSIIVNGNLIVDSMDVKSHKIACTGNVTAYSGSIPLSLILTDKEKEKIRAIYKRQGVECFQSIETATTRWVLEKIFGANLFKEK